MKKCFYNFFHNFLKHFYNVDKMFCVCWVGSIFQNEHWNLGSRSWSISWNPFLSTVYICTVPDKKTTTVTTINCFYNFFGNFLKRFYNVDKMFCVCWEFFAEKTVQVTGLVEAFVIKKCMYASQGVSVSYGANQRFYF